MSYHLISLYDWVSSCSPLLSGFPFTGSLGYCAALILSAVLLLLHFFSSVYPKWVFPMRIASAVPLFGVERPLGLSIAVYRGNSFSPGAPLTYFNDKGGGGGGCPTEVHILLPKNPNFKVCLPKTIPTFFSIPEKNPSVFLTGFRRP